MKIIDFATGLDFTDLRVSDEVADEEDFSSLVVQHSVDGIIAVDAKGCYTLWNPAMEKLTGLKSGDVVGKHFAKLFPEFVGSPIEAAYLETLSGKTVNLPPYSVTLDSGSVRVAQQKNIPLFNEGGEVVGVLLVVRDVTESMREIERLEAENAALRKRLDS